MKKSTEVQIIQFVHPGFEYHRSEHVGGRGVPFGVMDWKPGNSSHDRKFIVSRGSLFKPGTGRDHQDASLVFWGEWEGPSVFWRIDDSPGKPKPSIIHAPFRPERPPQGSVQDTDPMVFGDAFIYSNCLQGAYSSLRRLAEGSLILFGRHSRVGGTPEFSLDTCLVVNRVEPLEPLPFNSVAYGEDIIDDAVLSPLYTEGGAGTAFSVYFGKTRTEDGGSPFSFFPARQLEDPARFFARPKLTPRGALKQVISSENMQGIKGVTVGLGQRDAIWHEVVRQVVDQRCALGHRADSPPRLDLRAAEAAAVARRHPSADAPDGAFAGECVP
jgi:hypothetical protein